MVIILLSGIEFCMSCFMILLVYVKDVMMIILFFNCGKVLDIWILLKIVIWGKWLIMLIRLILGVLVCK